MHPVSAIFEAGSGFGRPVSDMAALPDAISAGPIDLRRWRPDDAGAVLAAVSASLAQLRLWMPWAQQAVSVDSYTDVLKDFHAAFDAGTEFGYGMFDRSGPEVVGACGLHFRGRPGVGEIGYWVRTDRHRRGYATAALRALTTAAFCHLDDIEQIHVTMDKANVASAGVPERLSYRLMAEEDRDVVTPGHTGRGLRWGVTRADWQRTPHWRSCP